MPGDRLIWYHRNTASAWPVTLKHQGLESLTARLDDPLLGRTFGAALARAGLEAGDLDLVELNEAFASQSVVCIDELGLNPDLVNVNGGAIRPRASSWVAPGYAFP